MKYLIDIETTLIPDMGKLPDTIWCIVVREPKRDAEPIIFTRDGEFGYRDLSEFPAFAAGVEQWIGHNIASFDIPVLNSLLHAGIDTTFPRVVDTFVVSRLCQYKFYSTHSLDEIGTKLGYSKTEFNDFSTLTEEMISYCVDDVNVNLAIYERQKRWIEDSSWSSSMWCEHEMHKICREMHNNGFYFNGTLAKRRLEQIEKEILELEVQMGNEIEPFEREDNPIKFTITAAGIPNAHVLASYEKYHRTEVRDGVLHRWQLVPFNPASSKDRVEKLWEYGWEPVEKTDHAYKFEKKARPGEMWGKTKLTPEIAAKKKKYYDYYGWTVNEVNLETLPTDAPEAARALAKWLTLDGRRKALVERLDNLEADYRIRTNFWHIGSWTGRMSHSAPNLANISSPFHGDPVSPVEEVKAEYDADMRRMFTVESGYLVGTDAESIQLRILAHYLRNDDYVHAILEGNKADETDIHNVNRRALRLEGLTRDHAKTFIYAWLLGAGVAKVARILGCSLARAKEAVGSFVESTHGLASLKRGQIVRDARRGYFVGLDGRKVLNDSAYLMLAGYLQNGEAVVMKHANILWRQWCLEEKIRFKQVNFVHDEWQTQVYGSLDMAERLGELQCKALTKAGEQLGCYCPMAGETRIGHDWLETH